MNFVHPCAPVFLLMLNITCVFGAGKRMGFLSTCFFFGDVFQSESTAFIPKAKPGKLNVEPENVSWENEKHLPANHYFWGFHVFSFFFRMCSEILS